MAVDLDAVLLDRIYQPCTDGLANVATCFGLARCALVVACESQAWTLFWDAISDKSGVNLVLSGLIAALTLFGAKQCWGLIGRVERQARTGGMNVRRITLRGQRLTWLAVCGSCSAVLASHPDIRSAFAIIACCAWVSMVYFVSCTPRPPARRHAGRFAGAFS